MVRCALFLVLPLIAVSCSVPGAKLDPNAYKAPRAIIVAEKSSEGPVRVDISLSAMTAQLLQGRDTLLAEMDVSTGEAGHRTPKGVFRITEKMPLKRSNRYGQYVEKDTREVIVARHWEHKGPKPAGTVYQGIAMPYWMRITADGVGMHVGDFPRGMTTSKGCIRCPEKGQTFFYQYCGIGTEVTIHDGPHPLPSALMND